MRMHTQHLWASRPSVVSQALSKAVLKQSINPHDCLPVYQAPLADGTWPSGTAGLGKLATVLQTATPVQGKAITAELFPKFDMQPLSGIMATLGHEWIDVLKVDVEGLEWPIMDSWLAAWDVLPFTQLQVIVLAAPCCKVAATGTASYSHDLHVFLLLIAACKSKCLNNVDCQPILWGTCCQQASRVEEALHHRAPERC